MTANSLRATGNKVVIKPLPLPEKSSGGLLYNVNWQHKPTEGTVLSVGGRTQHVKPGDRVSFSWINGTDVTVEDGEVKVIDENELLALHETIQPS